MPLSKEAQRAWQEQPPRRDIHHDTVAPMTRFGRKWLWDLTLNVPVHLLAEALEGAALFSDLLTELDDLLGARATPLSLASTVGFEDDYLLSGARAHSGEALWRFSARDMGSLLIVDSDPATFQLGSGSKPFVPVAGGRILQAPGKTSRAFAGLWLVANGSVEAARA